MSKDSTLKGAPVLFLKQGSLNPFYTFRIQGLLPDICLLYFVQRTERFSTMLLYSGSKGIVDTPGAFAASVR